jgi:hypothetical protein
MNVASVPLNATAVPPVNPCPLITTSVPGVALVGRKLVMSSRLNPDQAAADTTGPSTQRRFSRPSISTAQP